MAGMEMADCCKMAQMQSDSPEVLAARLFCVVNCQQPGTTGAQFSLRAPAFNIPFAPLPVTLFSNTFFRLLVRPSTGRVLPLNRQPSYIRNLALLI